MCSCLTLIEFKSGNVGLAVAIPVLLLLLVVVVVVIMRRRRVCLFPKKTIDASRKDSDMHSLPDSLIETRYSRSGVFINLFIQGKYRCVSYQTKWLTEFSITK